MARDFSKVSPNVWKSKKFWALPNDGVRLAYLFLLTCAHTNSGGCYRVPVAYISVDLNWDLKQAQEAIESLCENGLIAFDFDEHTVWIEQWFRFNPPTNANHALGILKDIKESPSAVLKSKAAQALKEVSEQKGFRLTEVFFGEVDRLSEEFREPPPTKTQTQTETQTQMETQTQTETPDQDSSSESSEPRASEPNPPPAALPDGAQGASLRQLRRGEEQEPASSHSLLDTPTMKRAGLKS